MPVHYCPRRPCPFCEPTEILGEVASLESRIQRLDAMLREAAALLREVPMLENYQMDADRWLQERDALLAEIAKEPKP